MKKINLGTAVTILLAIVPGALWAQKDVSFGTNMLIDSNIYRNYAGQSDVVLIPFANLGYQFSLDEGEKENDYFYLGYNGQFFLFRELSRRNFSTHQVGLDYNHLWPESRNMLAVGGKLETRVNPEDYKYYNYTTGGVYLNHKRYLRENLLFLARYNLTGKSFSEFSEFNFMENVLSLQTSLFLETRTTFSLEANYYHKNYTTGINNLDSIFVEPEEFLPSVGRRRGFGMFSQQRFAMPAEGYYWYTLKKEEFPSTDQAKLVLTLAQGLGSGTGLMVSYAGRINPHNRNRFLASLEESVLNNEELFDDHYSYVGHEGRLQLKQLLPAESTLTLLFTARRRSFSGRPAMDLEGYYLPSGENRLDRALLFEGEFTKRFSLGGNWLTKEFDISVQSGYGKNRSNDEYYNYSGGYFLFSFEKAL